MADKPKEYPDNTPIFTVKAEGRKLRAALIFAEKLAALADLKKRAEPIVRARQQRIFSHRAPNQDRT